MTHEQADVAIIGSGFGGSLTALILARAGLRPILLDRGKHPRFVLGESSTPLADMLLKSLAQKYDLPRVEPLAEYGTWQRAYPEMTCGLKRGFSYFHHHPGAAFRPDALHKNELLVEASIAAEDADAHWFRPEFDQFLVQEAQQAGIPFFDQTDVSLATSEAPWRLTCRRHDETFEESADCLVDASGDGGFLARQLAIPVEPDRMRTRSRAVYAHFTGVAEWGPMFENLGGNRRDHTFVCDDAALHHVVDGGWMYVLRFNNGVTSAGFLIDVDRHPLDRQISPEAEWRAWLDRYPSIAEQFRQAEVTQFCGGIRQSRRLQRRVRHAAGADWAMLPQAAYTLDALHSSGNAHTLYGIERLTSILEQRLPRESRQAALRQYDRILQEEIDLVDQIVHGCYRGFANFELFTSMAMFYFAGAHNSEDLRRRGAAQPENAFLLADNADFRRAVDGCHQRLCQITSHGATSQDTSEFYELVKQSIAPFNIAGLCDESRKNMYPFLCNQPR